MYAHPARFSDPESSHLAAEYIVSSGTQAHQQALAVASVRAFPGMTSFELAMATGHDRYMLARRLPECETRDLVFKGAMRKCSRSGRMAVTWWPEPQQMELRMVAA